MKKIIIILSYLIIFFNSNLLCEKKINFKSWFIGSSYRGIQRTWEFTFYSLQLALEEIDDEKVFIIPRDAGFNNKEKLNKCN